MSETIEVLLVDLKPSPFKKHMCEGKLDQDDVDHLAVSIKRWKWWGGLRGRKLKDGSVQIAFGHRRIAAAIQACGRDARMKIICEDYSDVDMLHLFAIENEYRSLTKQERVHLVALLRKWLTKHQEDCCAPERGNLQHVHGGPSCISEFIGGAGWSNQRVSELLSQVNPPEPTAPTPDTTQEAIHEAVETAVSPIQDQSTESVGVKDSMPETRTLSPEHQAYEDRLNAQREAERSPFLPGEGPVERHLRERREREDAAIQAAKAQDDKERTERENRKVRDSAGSAKGLVRSLQSTFKTYEKRFETELSWERVGELLLEEYRSVRVELVKLKNLLQKQIEQLHE